MCGRFTLTVGLGEIKDHFQVEEITSLDSVPRYNIAPTQSVPIVVYRENTRRLVSMRWGLIPYWAKDVSIGSRLINARSESLSEKPAFRHSFRRKRCLVPADSFYEWKKDTSGKKQPMRILFAQGDLFAFAGLWDQWTDPEESCTLHTFTIITTSANDKVRPIHPRMPVILDRSEEDLWLDPRIQDPDGLKSLLDPCDPAPMRTYPVSPIVNSPKIDQPECILPME